MKAIPVQEAVGLTLCHDITEIVPGGRKGPAFRRGHIIREEDIGHLLRLGKEHLYVWDTRNGDLIHEDDAARRIAAVAAGPGLSLTEPREGRINFQAAHQGLFQVNVELLRRINRVPDVALATIHSLQEVAKSRAVAGTRVIPLVVPAEVPEAVETLCREHGQVFSVLPFTPRRVGVITTGGEVFHGRIKDAFTPVLQKKLEAWGCAFHFHQTVPDVIEETVKAGRNALEAGSDLLLFTGGMSVDPDDKTPAAIRRLADRVVSYGSPVFPGAMFMLAYKDDAPLMGLPGCVMYHRASVFDLVMPRILAGVPVTGDDIADLGHGGFCDSCPDCRFPLCGFGKN